MAERGSILCISTYVKGQDFMREVARLGSEVTLLTEEKHRHADWPWESLAAFHTMPADLTPRQIINTVTYLARSRKFDRIVALDEFDMETAAVLREHMRLPGMGVTTTHFWRDKLAMRTEAASLGIRVPEFTGVFNYDELRAWMERVPAPWVLKPRTSASALGIKKLENSEQLWRTLEQLGDEQSFYILEQFVPGRVYHVDGIVNDRKVLAALAHAYGEAPMKLTHQGGVFTTRLLDRKSKLSKDLLKLHAEVVKAFRLLHGVTHTEYIVSEATEEIYFLEAAARVGGAFIADVIEASSGYNPWAEWARLEVASLRKEKYKLPDLRKDYAGSVLCLAQQETPDTSAYNDPEIVVRLNKKHHAGLIVRSQDPERVRALLESYSQRFIPDYCAVLPAPDKPTA